MKHFKAKQTPFRLKTMEVLIQWLSQMISILNNIARD